jgi:hypothetical protein
MMVFPANRVGGRMTTNGARGFHPRIKDRLDLTVECIRRHYRDEPSPLSDTLARYTNVFGLFRRFRRLRELFPPSGSGGRVHFQGQVFHPVEDFTVSPLPGTLEAYLGYRKRAVAFIESRNRRIAAHVR